MASADRSVSRVEALKVFVAEAPIDMIMLDRDAGIVAISPPCAANAGLSADEVTGHSIFEVFRVGREGFAAAWDAIARGEPNHLEVDRIAAPDGGSRWIQALATPWRDDAGDLAGLLFFNTDVTAEHRAEIERRQSELLLHAVIENLPGSVIVQDLETREFLLVNRTVETSMGLSRAEILGSKPATLFDAETIDTAEEHIRIAALSGEPHVSEARLVYPNGVRHVQVKRVIFEDSLGAKRILTITEDIAERHRAAEALRAAVADAEAANQAKTSFLANMSHEIRTPLNGVLGMAQAMAREPLSPSQQGRLDVIRQSGESLLRVLNDVLDISKIEAGKLELEAIEFDLDETLASAHAAFAAVAENRGLVLDYDVGNAAGLYLGDPARIRQVLSNLISNALKFTDFGEVTITAEQAGGEVRIVVRDTGLGMPPEVVDKLFANFVQADASTTRRFGGTGLGLAICRQLVDLMEGTIRAESTVGEGSRMILTLPLPRLGAARGPQDPAADRLVGPTARAMKVLAAEDNPVNQLVLRTLMDQLGIELEIVENGAMAIEAWATGGFEIILMDVQMPVMDGPSATLAIRSREQAEGRRRTPIIALTANAMSHHQAEYLGLGMDAVVSKPLQLTVLIEVMNQLLGEDPEEARQASA